MKRLSLAAILFAALSAPAQAPPKAPPEALDGPPVVTAKAWAVADGKTGQLLWGVNESESRPIASTTKIMTAWLVLSLAESDAKVLDETIIYSERAAATRGSSAKLQTGDRLPVRELFFGLLLPSGNDAAVALAEHFGGRFAANGPAGGDPLPLFIAEMNARAKTLGLTATSYVDPNGLGTNRSSARDLAVLTSHALNNERFREYVGTRRHEYAVTAASGEKRTVTWANTNKLLDVEGYDGVKTGTTTPAGNCLVASGRRGTDHLLVVVLGASSTDGKFVEARNLFRWGWRQRGHTAVGAATRGQ